MVGLEKSSEEDISHLHQQRLPHSYNTDFSLYNCSSVVEIEREDVVHSPGQTKGEGVRREGEMKGR